MSARKKGSKSASKKQEESHSKNRNAALLTHLTRQLPASRASRDTAALVPSLLQALLAQENEALDSLLNQWSQDEQAIELVAQHMLESKMPLLISKAIELLTQDRSKQYIYPWLAHLLRSHRGQSTEWERLQGEETVAGQVEGLMQLQGKLRLILQQ